MSDPTSASNPAPGWYQDPSGPDLRWWDGSTWTEHTHGHVETESAADASAATATESAAPAAGSPSSSAPDPDALMAMYGARPVSTTDRPSSSSAGYRNLLIVLGLGLVAIVLALVLLGGGDDEGGALEDATPEQLEASASETQSLARTAQTSAETFATDNAGSYEGMTPEDLVRIEPTLEGADIELSSDRASYSITVADPVSGGDFTIARDGSGVTSFGCTPEGTSSCPTGGNWGEGPQGIG